MDIHVDIRGFLGNPFMDMLWILGPGKLENSQRLRADYDERVLYSHEAGHY